MTIANFISSLDEEIIKLFRDILLICDEQGLIGKNMFAIDGCKLSSNASKEWSGTRCDFEKKAAKMERAISEIVKRHRENDNAKTDKEIFAKEEKYLETLRKGAKKIREWLSDNDDKMGKGGTPIKSNITDNESAKMKTSHGVIQGYDGVTAVDGRHQVIVHARSFDQALGHDLLEPMVEGVRENFRSIGKEDDIFKKAKLSADRGFHTNQRFSICAQVLSLFLKRRFWKTRAM